MAIILDESALDVIARRRARGKDATLYLRLERGSLRAGVPWILAVGWAPRYRPDRTLVSQLAANAEIHVEPRVARYTQSRDLTVSAARLGPWEWLVVADPFAFERMWEWEWTHPVVSLPPLVTGSLAQSGAGCNRFGSGERAPSKGMAASVGSLTYSGVLDSNIRSSTDRKGALSGLRSRQPREAVREDTNGEKYPDR